MYLCSSSGGYHMGTDYGTYAALANIDTAGSLINLICSVERWFTSVLLPHAPGVALRSCRTLLLLQKGHWVSQKSIFSCRFRHTWSLYDISCLLVILCAVSAISERPSKEEEVIPVVNTTGTHVLVSRSRIWSVWGPQHSALLCCCCGWPSGRMPVAVCFVVIGWLIVWGFFVSVVFCGFF